MTDGRRFEAVWTVDPRAVRHASRVAAALADDYRPGLHVRDLALLADEPSDPSGDLRRLVIGDVADLLAAATWQGRVRRGRHAEVVHIVGPDRPVIQQLEVGVDAPEIPDVD